MTGLSEQQLAEIGGRRYEVRSLAAADIDITALLAEVARLREERDQFANRMDTLTSVAKGNKRHVTSLMGDLSAAQSRVAELEAERHATNEALSDAAEAIRANESRWSAAENVIERAYRKGYDPDAAELAELLGTTEAWDAS